MARALLRGAARASTKHQSKAPMKKSVAQHEGQERYEGVEGQ
jgi:hypothetical protein